MKNKIMQQIKVPINVFLYGRKQFLQSKGMPSLSKEDYRIISQLRKSINVPKGKKDLQMKGIIADLNYSLKLAKNVSFYNFLRQEFIKESKKMAEYGIKNFVISIDQSPIVKTGMQNITYFILRLLSSQLKNMCVSFSDYKVGLLLPENCNEYSIDIACRSGLDFIIMKNCYGENYLKRNELSNILKTNAPKIYVDNIFKTNVFQDGIFYEEYLSSLEKMSRYLKNNRELFGDYKKEIILVLKDDIQMEFTKKTLQQIDFIYLKHNMKTEKIIQILEGKK